MKFNNLLKIFLKQREKNVNVNIVNNYNSYYENRYQDDNYFDNTNYNYNLWSSSKSCMALDFI